MFLLSHIRHSADGDVVVAVSYTHLDVYKRQPLRDAVRFIHGDERNIEVLYGRAEVLGRKALRRDVDELIQSLG